MNAQQSAKVPSRELTAMLIILVSTNAFLTYPRYVSQSANQAAWMEPIISGLGTLLLFYLVEWIMRNYFNDLDIVEICKELFGKLAAAVLGVLFACYFLCSTASVMREFTENVVSTVLPSTPILLVAGVFMLAVAYIAYAGLEGIARTAYVFLPILVIGIVGLCLATMNWWEPAFLLPFWGNGVSQIFVGSFQYSSIFTNVLLLTIIYPHAHDATKMKTIGLYSILVSTALLVVLMLSYNMVFSPQETSHSSFALYQLARLIYMGPFFQRVESVFIFLWVTAATVRMAVTLWGAAYLVSKAFGWPTYRPGVPALAMLTLGVGMWLDNWIEVVNLDGTYLMRWGWVVVFALPVAILVIGWISLRMRGNRRQRTAMKV